VVFGELRNISLLGVLGFEVLGIALGPRTWCKFH